MGRVTLVLFVLLPAALTAQEGPGPIIDMHLHALPATWFGPPPVPICVGARFPPADPARQSPEETQDCEVGLTSPTTDHEIMEGTLALMERYGVVGLTSGPPEVLRRWRAASPGRILGSVFTDWQDPSTVDSIRAWAARGEIVAIGEVTTQYAGADPSDLAYEPFWALAEELDLPISIHVGLGPPGAAYVGYPDFRMALSDPLILEEALVRHPGVRVSVMHAGWPFLEEMIALLYAHPQVNVDLGVISFVLPRAEFHRYLRGLVEAGFEKRVMFGSDQMIWPEALEAAIWNVESAPFLSDAQKRDIFYGNAARFLRLSEDEIARHHGRTP